MNFFHTVLSAIFPPTHDEQLLASLSEAELLGKVRVREIPHGMSFLPYRDPVVRALIWQTKYKRDDRAIALLSKILHEQLLQIKAPHLIIPIPLSTKRSRERGYNQVSAFAERAVAGTPHTFLEHALIRTRHTIPQTQLSRKERLVNLHDAFAVPDTHKERIKDASCILVDDVTTTSTTLGEARRTLLTAGAKMVTVVAMAH